MISILRRLKITWSTLQNKLEYKLHNSETFLVVFFCILGIFYFHHFSVSVLEKMASNVRVNFPISCFLFISANK